MRAARLHAAGDLRLADEPVPRPEPGETLVRVTAVGICGSDLHWWDEAQIGDAALARPLVLGHEAAGVIEEGPLHGIRVAIDPAIPCGACRPCRDGYRNLCTRIRFAGHGGQDGALREFMTWPAHRLHALPGGLSDADGALLEPLGVALHALDLGHVRLDASVAVVGCGPIGLLLIQVLRAAGAGQIIAFEPLPHRRAAATRLGADLAADPAELANAGDMREVIGDGADVSFEMAGTDDAVRLAMLAVRPGGRVVLGGIPAGDLTTFPASTARRKGLTIAMVRRMNEAYPRAISLAASGRVELTTLVTHRFGLAKVAEAFGVAATRGGLKVIVEPWSDVPSEEPATGPDAEPATGPDAEPARGPDADPATGPGAEPATGPAPEPATPECAAWRRRPARLTPPGHRPPVREADRGRRGAPSRTADSARRGVPGLEG